MYYIITEATHPAAHFSHLIRWHIFNGYGIPRFHPDPETNDHIFALVQQDDQTICTHVNKHHEMRPVLKQELKLRQEGGVS